MAIPSVANKRRRRFKPYTARKIQSTISITVVRILFQVSKGLLLQCGSVCSSSQLIRAAGPSQPEGARNPALRRPSLAYQLGQVVQNVVVRGNQDGDRKDAVHPKRDLGARRMKGMSEVSMVSLSRHRITTSCRATSTEVTTT